MKFNLFAKSLVLQGEDGETLRLNATNQGEPYRNGIQFSFDYDDKSVYGFFEERDARALRDFLNEALGDNK